MPQTESVWFEIVRSYTEQLVRLRAFSPSVDERAVAAALLGLLTEGALASAYTAAGIDPIEGDALGRGNVFAFVRGRQPETVVLLGHYDTVDTADYGPQEPWATDPAGLAQRLDWLSALTPGLQADLDAHPGDWLFGRGTADMKSGVAAGLAVIRRIAEAAASGDPPAVGVLFLATADEETESAGVLQAVRFLLRLRDEQRLTYLGVVNTDYTEAEYPGDTHRYAYSGTVGKLLPAFFVVGRESHVGLPFAGIDANLLAAELIRDLSMNVSFCDRVHGRVTAPPITLHAADLKTRYDVQIPFAANLYFNVLTLTSDPGWLLQRLRRCAEAAQARVLERLDEAEIRWRTDGHGSKHVVPPREGIVLTFAELRKRAEQRAGREQVEREMEEEWQRWPADLDKRERSVHLVRRLWMLSGEHGPAIVIYYCPPYYPHVPPSAGPLRNAIAATIASHPDLQLAERKYYPYISDLSYMGVDPGADISALTANMPVWQDSDAPTRPGSYTLPLDDIRQLDLPAVNLGPYGRGVHQRGEAVLMSYSFGVLPQLLWEVIRNLGEPAAG
jgi:arginine utilization protein RocB